MGGSIDPEPGRPGRSRVRARFIAGAGVLAAAVALAAPALSADDDPPASAPRSEWFRADTRSRARARAAARVGRSRRRVERVGRCLRVGGRQRRRATRVGVDVRHRQSGDSHDECGRAGRRRLGRRAESRGHHAVVGECRASRRSSHAPNGSTSVSSSSISTSTNDGTNASASVAGSTHIPDVPDVPDLPDMPDLPHPTNGTPGGHGH